MKTLTSAITTAAIALMIGLTSIGNVAAAPNVPSKAAIKSDVEQAQYRRDRFYEDDDDDGYYSRRERRHDRWRRHHERKRHWSRGYDDNDHHRDRRHKRPRFEIYID